MRKQVGRLFGDLVGGQGGAREGVENLFERRPRSSIYRKHHSFMHLSRTVSAIVHDPSFSLRNSDGCGALSQLRHATNREKEVGELTTLLVISDAPQ